MSPWLDDLEPFEPERSAAQIAALIAALPERARVLDIGAGGGRVTAPLLEAGFDVTAIEANAAHCELVRGAAPRARVIHGTFPHALPDEVPDANKDGESRFDAVLILGNTIMTYAEVIDAVGLLAAARVRLRPGGAVWIDDVAGDFWPELVEGFWQRGTTEGGDMQIAWADDDAVFTIRIDEAVLPPDHVDVDRPCAGEPRYRLWTAGALALASAAAGLSTPERLEDGGLIALRSLQQGEGGCARGPT